ncbi:MAG: TIGR04283 family arsenosugar biosynthesis glycosyltransferase [Gammaproteobacteria bacterium]|nr:TIGR04283 family arsenosugar biosynthesis glycosyltransferase [Gammaproteobacteria bacterium]
MRISVIIPTLNECKHIAQTLLCLQVMRQHGNEVILVDAGSDDNTVEVATPLCDLVIITKRGRAHQMQAGINKSCGDVLWFLHGDTIVSENTYFLIQQALNKHLWGRFNVTINSQYKFLRLVAFMMNLRSCITGVCTGDQGIFVKKEIYTQVGGFPIIPLMEDIALSKKLKRLGRPACIKTSINTSGRRWESHGVIKTILLMWLLRMLYFFGKNPVSLKKYYK